MIWLLTKYIGNVWRIFIILYSISDYSNVLVNMFKIFVLHFRN
uniref:Uncharacterized protein n=1 Tax=Anguilla anguilla TaxID=7936 RepID=A0A0E9V6J9_ANGAN